MRRLVLLILSAAACSAPGVQVAPTPQTIMTSEAGIMRTNPVEGATIDSLPMTPDQGLRALMAAYQRMGIEVTLVDPANRRIGNPNLVATRTLGGERLSRFVSCGQSRTGVRADESRVYINVVSVVRTAAAGKSVVETRLEANAQDVTSGNTTDRIPCSTTGVLETRVHAAAKGG